MSENDEIKEVEESPPPTYLSYAKDIVGGSPEKALAYAAIKIAEELHQLNKNFESVTERASVVDHEYSSIRTSSL